MPFLGQDTPSRAGYTGAATAARSPCLTSGHRAELRRAMAALRDPSDADAKDASARPAAPVWPAGGPTRPVAPALAAARAWPADGGDEADNEDGDGGGSGGIDFTPLPRSQAWPTSRPTRPRPPSLSVPRATVTVAHGTGGSAAEARRPQSQVWSGHTIPRAPTFSTVSRSAAPTGASDPQQPEAAAATRRSQSQVWTGRTVPRAPMLSTMSRSAASASTDPKQPETDGETRQPLSQNWSGHTVPHAPTLSTTSRSRKYVAFNMGETLADGGSEEVPAPRAAPVWSGAGTIPRPPSFSARRLPQSVNIACQQVATPSKPSRSVEERRAAFERLTRPRQPPAAVTRIANPMGPFTRKSSTPAIRGEDRRAIFERLTRPRLNPPQEIGFAENATVGTGPTAQVAASVARYNARPTATRGFPHSGPDSSRFSVRTASNPTVLQSRRQNVPATQYVPGRTVPRPFRLKSVELHDAAMAKFEQQVKRESALLEQKRRYQAVPLREDMLKGPTFEPKFAPQDQIVTVPEEDFCCRSDMRALSRAEFEERTRARVEEDERAKREAAAAREELFEQQLAAKYQVQRFRARPVPTFHLSAATLPRLPPSLPPTSPHTPHLSTRFRTRSAALARLLHTGDEGNMVDRSLPVSPSP
jgi:Targeting protein for Xklp2 (TPX2) domain